MSVTVYPDCPCCSGSGSGSGVGSGSGSGSGITNTCCPGKTFGTTLSATFTGSFTGTFTLTWNGSVWIATVDSTTGFCAGGPSSVLSVYCDAGTWKWTLTGAGGACVAGGALTFSSVTCTPLELVATLGANATCCNTGFTLTVTG